MTKTRLNHLFTGLMMLVLGNCHAQLPDNYQTLPADHKQILLWQQIESSHDEQGLPDLLQNDFWRTLKVIKGLFSLKPSFDHINDEIPKGLVKILHANGSVAKIHLTPASGHPFTGLYQTGAIGLARLSLATTPKDDSFIPGMAIKLLLPSHPSLNLHVMNALEGQGSNWNFFAKPFSNKIAHPKSYLLKAIEKIFEWTKRPANELNIESLAEWNDQGEPVEHAIAPEVLLFKPSEAVQNLIDENDRQDFRLNLAKIPYGPIYELYGSYQGVEYHIGTLSLESELLASNYGDKVLFFQHQR